MEAEMDLLPAVGNIKSVFFLSTLGEFATLAEPGLDVRLQISKDCTCMNCKMKGKVSE